MLPARSKLVFTLLLLAAVASCVAAQAAGKKPKRGKDDGQVAGILFNFDLKAHWVTVKADGEEAPIKYTYDPADPGLAAALGKTVFPAARVQLVYKKNGDARQLAAIERQVFANTGVVTGTVIAIHDNFWLELQPQNGLPNAFAPGANYNDKAFMERFRALQPGDSVTLEFNTDFERHRIVALQKNPDGPKSKNLKKPAKTSKAKG